MKNNNYLYGAVVVLALIVIAVGYSKYAGEHRAEPETIAASEDTMATDETETAADIAAPAPGDEMASETAVEDTAMESAANTETDTAAPAISEDTPSPSTEGMDEAAPAPEAASEATDDQTAVEPAPAGDDSLLAAPASLQMNVQDMMVDRVLGDVNAPVTIVEYASYTCSHCAHFANTIMADVKAQLVDTGKAKLILREFPLDKIALKASQMARCAPADKYYDLAEVIFRNQERWLKSDNPEQSLMQLGSLAGMDADMMKACMGNAELETAILERMARAQREVKVTSTPTFVFNEGEEILTGAQPVESFVKAVEKLTR